MHVPNYGLFNTLRSFNIFKFFFDMEICLITKYRHF